MHTIVEKYRSCQSVRSPILVTSPYGTPPGFVPTYRLLKASGVDPTGIVACDSKGTLHRGRGDIEAEQAGFRDKWQVCCESNCENVMGGIGEALRGADVCIAFSQPGPNVIRPQWIKGMAEDAVVLACANPVPEIWPWEAAEAGARIVATGRGDFPNQVNNSLGFPGIFRGVLDVRARTVSDEMAMAAAEALARYAEERGINEENILPKMTEQAAFVSVAVATAMKAQEQGIARLTKTRGQLHEEARCTIQQAQEATKLLMRERLIPQRP